MNQMKENKKDFYQTINEQLIAAFSSSQKLNYCRFFMPEKNGLISLVAKYAPCYSVETAKRNSANPAEPYVTLAASNVAEDGLAVVESRDYEAYYYGISPAIDETVIVESIADGRLTSKAGLDSFIAEHCTGFMLHHNQREYLIPCARLFVLSIAHNFGIKLKVDGDLYEHLLRFSNTTMVEKGTQQGEILLCGSPTEELFCELDGYFFQQEEDRLHWKCCSPDAEGLSVRDIFGKRENMVLLKGHTFYSGALLRILYIDNEVRSYGNDTVAPLQFLFERSSYGTVYTLDNNYINHPLLRTSRDRLVEMYRKDDDCKRRLLEKTESVGSKADYIAAVNDYLKESFNVNQMGVTGNVITEDGILLIGERESASIDAGEIYPTINLGNTRIDFYGELNREAQAELSISTRLDAWHCYGFTISGNIPKAESGEEYTFTKRRMHFNILCEQVCNDSFEKMVEKQKNATEAFENRMLKGLQLDYYPNSRSMLWERILNGCRVILDNESHVMAVTAVCVFISAIITAYQNGSLTSMTFSLSDILSISFSILAVLMIIVIGHKTAKKYRFKRKHITKIRIVGNRNGNHTDGFSHITKYFEKHSCHPVAYAAVMAHILKKAEYK